MNILKSKIYGRRIDIILSEILLIFSVSGGKEVCVNLLFTLAGSNDVDSVDRFPLLMESKKGFSDNLRA